MEVNKVEGKKETPIHYEVTIEVDGKKSEVIVSLDGKTVKTEAEEKKEKK
jgi:chaperone required for assembly of F1-ATPase